MTDAQTRPSPLTFTSPHGIQACLDVLRSHQAMPTAGSFGFWIDVESASDTHAVAYVKLLFGNGAFRPIAWYTVTFDAAETGTEVSVVMTDFNYTMAAGFAVISLAGAGFVLLSPPSSGAVLLLVIFLGFGVFGYFFTRAQYGDASRLPATIREWLR